MPKINDSEVQSAWLGFVNAVRLVIIPQQDDRPLDQYLAFRDSAFSIVQSKEFLENLHLNLVTIGETEYPSITDALLLELKSFPRAIEVAQTTEKADTGSKSWLSRWIGRASTVTGSVKDVAQDNALVKGGLTIFQEMCDIFKG